jgi:hypothetical protein
MECLKSNSIKNESPDINLENSQSNMNSCQFKEIIVVEDFEVDNGVLGLHRDVYLSIIKFLHSSIVRKVRLDTFVLFNFVFFFW